MRRNFKLFLAAVAGLSPGVARAGDPAAPTWDEVAAVLALRCVNCHSAQGAGRGLRLDSYEAVLTGGENGAVVIAGDPGTSELVRRLRGESVPRMPFLGRPLPAEELDLIVRWVDAGMPGPGP